MSIDTKKQDVQPYRGTDLERWRTSNGLTKAEAADAFGLQKARWDKLTNAEQSLEPLSDPLVAMLLHLYQHVPGAAPVQLPPDVPEFYEFLGFQDNPQDRDTFSTLIGRSPSSAIRLLLHGGTPGRPLIRWIEAVQRLKMSPKQSLRVMFDVASSVGDRQGVEDVLVRGWSRYGEASDDE
jgi:hypothetical protein